MSKENNGPVEKSIPPNAIKINEITDFIIDGNATNDDLCPYFFHKRMHVCVLELGKTINQQKTCAYA